eukprot:TRINITY_DN48591_c0_g1_i2.p1 TRINITY_DN48591_c0_g1~~TRINITY_DN48591_c0_g1_i2.p1  ORF type:complete len:354 (-),score=35.91 TRINITY_DN48591_c0_g1_i2:163-1143(-)
MKSYNIPKQYIKLTVNVHDIRRKHKRLNVSMNATIKFSKYHGLGNDFILIDNRHQQDPVITEQQAVQICNRNFGVGADGVIFALPPENGTDFTMRIFNSDGSEPEMCGNGIRCLAKFISDVDAKNNGKVESSEKFKINTLAGLIQPEMLADGRVCVDMGEPILEGVNIPTTLQGSDNGTVIKAPLQVDGKTWRVTCVSMGNPHAVIYSNDEEGEVDLQRIEPELNRIGPMFENDAVFPARTNTEFVQVMSKDHVKMVVWERGAGRTLACGTGACALVVAGVLEGRINRICKVDLPGGPLDIEWRESDNRCYMTGPAELVFNGSLDV